MQHDTQCSYSEQQPSSVLHLHVHQHLVLSTTQLHPRPPCRNTQVVSMLTSLCCLRNVCSSALQNLASNVQLQTHVLQEYWSPFRQQPEMESSCSRGHT